MDWDAEAADQRQLGTASLEELARIVSRMRTLRLATRQRPERDLGTGAFQEHLYRCPPKRGLSCPLAEPRLGYAGRYQCRRGSGGRVLHWRQGRAQRRGCIPTTCGNPTVPRISCTSLLSGRVCFRSPCSDSASGTNRFPPLWGPIPSLEASIGSTRGRAGSTRGKSRRRSTRRTCPGPAVCRSRGIRVSAASSALFLTYFL